jgi:nitroreductase
MPSRSKNQLAIDARYGGGAPAVGPWNTTLDLLLAHRSVRRYSAAPLPEGTLETLVAAAQSAATSSNLQTWSVVAVDDPAARGEFAAIARNQRHIEQCPLFLVWLADLSRLDRMTHNDSAPADALPFMEMFLTAAIDASLAAQNAVVAAESLGLATVYIGALRNDPEAVARRLALPPGVFGMFGLCVGYEAPGDDAQVKPRLPQAAVLHRERYDVNAGERARASYDSTLAAFSQKAGMGRITWSQRVKDRIGNARSLNGRDQLKPILRRLGFELR